eukprot:TRINITY_DN3903_c1_g2_i1.p1 TRINITY_DN3903_c1_g2~~TRINITY_DN3903_c1_g2_i1.p1  ORF type:complete len:526 (+),score=106.94 TRINITY_DN3903_c1_g2_i1:68-1579(+)
MSPLHSSCACVLVFLVLMSVCALPAMSMSNVAVAATNTSDLITTLPGIALEDIPFAQYSGYINLEPNSSSTERNTFYWLVESQNDPSTDPLVVWFQGGPGCSGLYALFVENGPFTPQPNGNLTLNPLSWNKFANVLYFESPLGVGFSYGEHSDGSKYNYSTNDTATTIDTYTFLNLFLEQYPEYEDRALWFTGESYAGNYVPQLVDYLLTVGTDHTLLNNLQGFALGNPVIACNKSLPSYTTLMSTLQVNLFYWHGSISYALYAQWNDNNCQNSSSPHVCTQVSKDIYKQMGNSFNPDDLYANSCTGNSTLGLVESAGDCRASNVDDMLRAYLNSANVQTAIHADRPGVKWVECNNIPYATPWPNMLTYYTSIFGSNATLKVLIYSGDVDIATVPHAYTQECLAELQRPQLSGGEWQQWTVGGYLAGYVEYYDMYTYATIKGSGHEAPLYQPTSAYNLLSRFITGQSITESNNQHHMRGLEHHSRPTMRDIFHKYSMEMRDQT